MREDFKTTFPVSDDFARATAGTPQKSTPSPRITLRLSEEENAKLRDLAAGMSVSAYIRTCVFGGDATRRKRRSHMPVKDQEAMARALALLGASRIANNLNQLAHQANIGTLIMDDDALVQIDETYAHVRQMRDELVSALGLVEA